jgi:hypothetical protein
MRFRRARLNATETDVKVFVVLGRLLAEWRDDPERLAVAVYAYENVLGYCYAGDEIEYGHPNAPMIPREEARRLRDQALYRRNRRVLRARAEGLVLALQSLAEAADAWRLHETQVESAVIECRQLSIEERLERLRAKEAA